MKQIRLWEEIFSISVAQTLKVLWILLLTYKFKHLFTVELDEILLVKHRFADWKMAAGLQTSS